MADFDIEFEPSNDPLRRDARAALRVDVRVHGRRIRFESNSPTVIGILRSAFVEGPTHAAGRGSPEAVVRVIVIEGDEGSERARRVRRFHPEAGRILIATSGSIALGDALRAEGLLYVTPGLVRERETFLTSFIEPVARAALAAAAAGHSGPIVAARSESDAE